MKNPKFIMPFAIIVIFGAGALGVQQIFSVSPVYQPLQFNHKFHKEKLGLECVRCHKGINSGYAATRPRIETCIACKSDIMDGSQTKQKEKLIGLNAKKAKGTLNENEKLFMQHLTDNSPIDWHPIYQLKRHVYFSHRRHVAIAELKCTTCHGDIENMETLPLRPIQDTLLMYKCLECHEEKGKSTDCVSCHR